MSETLDECECTTCPVCEGEVHLLILLSREKDKRIAALTAERDQMERAYNSAEQRGDMWRTRALEAAEFIEDAAYWFFNVNQKQAGNECVAAARRARGE